MTPGSLERVVLRVPDPDEAAERLAAAGVDARRDGGMATAETRRRPGARARAGRGRTSPTSTTSSCGCRAPRPPSPASRSSGSSASGDRLRVAGKERRRARRRRARGRAAAAQPPGVARRPARTTSSGRRGRAGSRSPTSWTPPTRAPSSSGAPTGSSSSTSSTSRASRSSEPPVADLVVAGAGMAGLVAAAEARLPRRAGARPREGRPPGRLDAALERGRLAPPRARATSARECPGGDPVLQRLVHERLDDDLGWLEALGATVVRRETGNPRHGRRPLRHARR